MQAWSRRASRGRGTASPSAASRLPGAADTSAQDLFPQGAAGGRAETDRDAALQRVFDAEWAPMVRLATLLLSGDERRAEEVVQDALLGLHRAWPRLADTDRAAGYLRRSVVNGCRGVHRHRLVEERHLRLLPRDDASPGSLDAEAAEHDRVLRAMRTLPVRQREVLVLRYWADTDEAGIARILGISRGAVKTHAHRGLAAVRTTLDEQTEADHG